MEKLLGLSVLRAQGIQFILGYLKKSVLRENKKKKIENNNNRRVNQKHA